MSLQVLYSDEDVVVINKPAGLLVHRSMLDRFERRFAMQILRDQLGRHVFPVHRLDRPTSGALVFGLSPESARALSALFAERQVHKEYLAIVRGIPKERETTLDYPLREEHDAIGDRDAQTDKSAQSAVTQLRHMASVELPVMVDRYPTSRYALVNAVPLTGRKHQIRRHLRHLGHPILGDITHGVGKHNRYFAEALGVRRLLLACTRISFRHPVRDEKIDVRAPLDDEFMSALHQLGWSAHATH